VLSQFWGQMGHKIPERRVLIAEACGFLSEYVKPHLRSSLLLSVLTSFSDDKFEAVRNAASVSLSKIIVGFEDKDKYQQVEQLFLKLLADPSELVVKTTIDQFAPAMAQFASNFNCIFDAYATTLLSQMESEIFKKSSRYTDQMVLLLQAFRAAIPKFYDNVLKTIPDSLTKIDKDRTAALKKFLETQLSQDIEKAKGFWDTLDWCSTKLIKRILTIIVSVDVAESQVRFLNFSHSILGYQ
jgi:hypothetical protein